MSVFDDPRGKLQWLEDELLEDEEEDFPEEDEEEEEDIELDESIAPEGSAGVIEHIVDSTVNGSTVETNKISAEDVKLFENDILIL